jgi:hypothetical protein
MRPVEGHPGVWECPKHGLFATVLAKERVDEIERGDAFPMHDGTEGIAGRAGEDRPGGVVFYYRAKNG